MKSPFPGKDPFLEPHWGDVHQSLVTCSRDMIDYSLEPDPALSQGDALGADPLLREQGKR